MTEQTLKKGIDEKVGGSATHQNKTLPKGWQEVVLGKVVEIIDGDRGNNYPNEFSNGGYCLFLNTKNVPSTEFSFSNLMFISREKDEQLGKGKLNRFDFVLTTRGTLGNFAFYSDKITFENIRINSGMVILRVNETILENLYFKFYLKSSFFQKQIIKLSSGSAQPQLPIRDLQNITVLFPEDTGEQKAIADMLSSFDDKIELLREENETLEKIGQELFKEWFGKYKVGDDLPDGWRVGKLGEIINIFDSQRVPLALNEREQRKGKYPYYGATKIMDYIDNFLFNGTYLLMAEDGSVMTDEGFPFLQYVWGKIWVNNHTHVLQGVNGFSTELLYVILRKRKIAGIVNGAVQLKINQTNLKNLKIIIPTKKVLSECDTAIKPLFEKIKNNSEQIQTLSKTRDELLPKLMRGEIVVH